MSERVEQATRAVREHVELGWDDAHVEVLLQRAKARARRRALARTTLAAAAMVALGVGAWWALPFGGAEAPTVATRPRATTVEGRAIRLGDGSVVTPLGESAEVIVVRVSDEEILLDLRRGAARFDVVPGLPRDFAVTAGEVRVGVVGTVFEVEREGEGAAVRVLEGRVRVSWPPDGEAILSAGEADHFPRAGAESPTRRGTAAHRARAGEGEPHASARELAEAPRAEADSAPPEREEPAIARAEAPPRARAEARSRARAEAAPRRGGTPRAPAPPPAWVAHAERGEYEEAARLLDAAGALETRDLDVLLLAADTMRLTGQPERALGYLDRAAALAQNDPRAPLVAFTRGRLLLTALSRPSEAAGAFAQARALAADRSLAMDAAAREVEALARAGDAEAARARAEEYVARYPNGLRVDAVRRWGGLTPP